MEKKLEDTGLGKVLYMMSVFKNAITEADSAQTNAAQDVENQHKDGNSITAIRYSHITLIYFSFFYSQTAL